MSVKSFLSYKTIHAPSGSTKEEQRVWSIWCNIGDREVIREAAVKGIYVKLAIAFLSARNQTSYENAEEFFNQEVNLWIIELLNRKQIFRVCHILNNTKSDPILEMTQIFVETQKKDLRDYIGNHLLKSQKMNDNLIKMWNLLVTIEEKSDILEPEEKCIRSISELNKKDHNWRSRVGTKLFFATFNFHLKPHLEKETIWEFLLKNNCKNILKFWINLSFSEMDCDLDNLTLDTKNNLKEIFENLHIDQQMINSLNNFENETEEFVLNELCKFGRFNSKEINDPVCLIKRVSSTVGLTKLYELLKIDHQTLPFFDSLIKFCLESKQFVPLNAILDADKIENLNYKNFNSEHLNLMISSRQLYSNWNNYDFFIKNVFDCAKLVSNNDLKKYFVGNPIIFLALILLYRKNLMKPVMENQSEFIEDLEITNELLVNSLEKIPTLCSFLRQISGDKRKTATLYQLVERHSKLIVNEVFKFRFTEESYPTFSLHSFENVHNKKINYSTYLKLERPSYSAFKYISANAKQNCKETAEKVKRLAYKNYFNKNLTSTCVAFLRMIDQDCHELRVNLQIANLLDRIEEGRGSILFSLEPEKVIRDVETLYLPDIDNLNESFNCYDFGEILNKYKIILSFSKIHGARYPEILPSKLAEANHWLPFLTFVQFFNYPEDEVQKFSFKFKNQALLEHLSHAVVHVIKVEESKSSIMREHNSRSSFLSRIGVRKTLENTPNIGSSDQGYSSASILSQTSLSSSAETSSGSSAISEIETEFSWNGEPIDLLKVLVRCHNSTDPPKMLLKAAHIFKYPLLAILATSYEPDSVLTNWLTWLSVSTNLDHKYKSADDIIYNAKLVRKIIIEVLQNNYYISLLESFQIFLPQENPLKYLLEIICNVSKGDFEESSAYEKLENFTKYLNKLKICHVDIDLDRDLSYIKNRKWVEKTAFALLAATFDYIFTSSYQQLNFLKLLLKLEVFNCLPISQNYLENSLKIIESIFDNRCKIRPKFSEMFYENSRLKYLQNYIDELIQKKFYKVAYEIGKIEGISLDHIILQKWEDEFNEKHKENYFWSTTLMEFEKINCKEQVLCVLEKCTEKVETEAEKFEVLKTTLEWAAMHNLNDVEDIEKKLWISFLNLKNYDFQFSFFKEPEFLYYSQLKKNITVVNFTEDELNNITPADRSYIGTLIDSLLNSEKFALALKISKIFRHKHEDLAILTLCLSLAEGLLLPSQLRVEQRQLINKAAHLRKFSQHGSRLSNLGSGWYAAKSSLNFDDYCNDTVKILEVLSEKVKNGAKLAEKTFLTFRISSNIDRNYHQILECKKPIELLKVAFKEDCRNKLQVIHDFITVWKWSKEEVADFVSEEVITAIDTFTKAKLEGTVLWDLDLDRDFPLILQFLPESTSSTLGVKLYSYASALYKVQNVNEGEFKISELQIIIELLVRAHDCFTADCNMEGISVILRKSKSIINVLLSIKSWKLIVRLLTGVGRYTEMSYVFQILKENDHFEFLLRKGNRRDNSLKIALLEYLKKYCPENRELYRMVALHFTLYSEIAQLWEEEAQTLIKNLITISKFEMQNNGLNPDAETFVLLSNSDGTKKNLNKAMQNYTHAAEYHLQGEKLMKAMQSAKKAQLIALQLSILKGIGVNGTCSCLLNLNSVQITNLITFHLRFPQSLILAEAYNYQPDWASALYEQYVIQNNQSYLENFMSSFPLTDSLVNDVSRKFLTATIITSAMAKNMKEILKRLPSVHTKYRIASELGFMDLIEDMLTENQLTYLKDTVWKKGYKNNN